MAQLAVLMPCRDAGKYVQAAIDSILAQTFTDFDLLAIDDGSTDETNDIIRSYRDPRVRLIAAEGSGVPAALNTGLRACAHYPLAARHDADDLSHPDRFAAQVSYLTTHPQTTVLATQAKLITADGSYLGEFTRTPLDHAGIVAALKVNNPVCHASVVYRPDRVLEAGGYDESYPRAQGYDLWVRMAGAYRIEAVPQVLYSYRIHDESVSRTQQALSTELMNKVRARAIDQLDETAAPPGSDGGPGAPGRKDADAAV